MPTSVLIYQGKKQKQSQRRQFFKKDCSYLKITVESTLYYQQLTRMRGIHSRASENFRGCLPQSSLKNLGQILTALAIWGRLERFSLGPNGSEVGRQITLNSLALHPTSEPFGPGEIFSLSVISV